MRSLVAVVASSSSGQPQRQPSGIGGDPARLTGPTVGSSEKTPFHSICPVQQRSTKIFLSGALKTEHACDLHKPPVSLKIRCLLPGGLKSAALERVRAGESGEEVAMVLMGSVLSV